jgi:hypothetical protein
VLLRIPRYQLVFSLIQFGLSNFQRPSNMYYVTFAL